MHAVSGRNALHVLESVLVYEGTINGRSDGSVVGHVVDAESAELLRREPVNRICQRDALNTARRAKVILKLFGEGGNDDAAETVRHDEDCARVVEELAPNGFGVFHRRPLLVLVRVHDEDGPAELLRPFDVGELSALLEVLVDDESPGPLTRPDDARAVNQDQHRIRLEIRTREHERLEVIVAYFDAFEAEVAFEALVDDLVD